MVTALAPVWPAVDVHWASLPHPLGEKQFGHVAPPSSDGFDTRFVAVTAAGAAPTPSPAPGSATNTMASRMLSRANCDTARLGTIRSPRVAGLMTARRDARAVWRSGPFDNGLIRSSERRCSGRGATGLAEGVESRGAGRSGTAGGGAVGWDCGSGEAEGSETERSGAIPLEWGVLASGSATRSPGTGGKSNHRSVSDDAQGLRCRIDADPTMECLFTGRLSDGRPRAGIGAVGDAGCSDRRRSA